MTVNYSIAEEFSKTPGGRFQRNGPYSGEEFRERVLRDRLNEAVKCDDILVVELGGTSGYGSAFLEEAFGGLIRLGLFEKDAVQQHLRISATDSLYEIYKISAEQYIEEARPQRMTQVNSGTAPSSATPDS